MTAATDTPPPHRPATENTDNSATGAVIARPGRNGESWNGRYLHHAPGPSASVRLILDVVAARSTVRTRLSTARRELIDDHPAGLQHLGAATAKDPQIKARRNPAAAGSCYCHTPDGQPRPAFLEQLLGMLHRGEQSYWSSSKDRAKVMPCTLDPTDATPWLMSADHDVPARIAYAFILRGEGITIAVRDGGNPSRYLKAGEVSWKGEADWEQIDRTAAAIRARTANDLARAEAASAMTGVAEHLGTLVHGERALEILRQRTYNTPPGTRAEISRALARTAGTSAGQLPDHLRGTGLAAQIELLTAAAAHIPVPDGYPTA